MPKLHTMTKVVQVFPSPQSLIFLRGQTAYMTERGFETTVISSPGPLLGQYGRELDVRTIEVPMRRDISPRHDLMSIYGLMRVIKALDPEIVEINTVKGGIIGLPAATLAKAPIRIYHHHGPSALGYSRIQDLAVIASEKFSAALSTRIFAVSDSVKELAEDSGWWPKGKACVLGGGSCNGVDSVTRFNPSEFDVSKRAELRRRFGIDIDATVIGYVGRVANLKGIVELQQAWHQIRPDSPNTVLLIVGDEDENDAVSIGILEQFHTDSSVILSASMSDIESAYACMDLVVLPSYREGLPNVPLEASSMELPVVATRIPGNVDAVMDGITGTLVQPRDVAELVAAIRMYLCDPPLRRQHGVAGRERVQQIFRREVIWEAKYHEYCQLLRKRGLPVPEPVGDFT